MNKFLNKLICIILNFTVLTTPAPTQANIILSVTKVISNAIGLGLALYAKNELNVYKNIKDDRIKYAYAAIGIFTYNLILNAFEIKSKLSDSKIKEKLENKVNKLEIENAVLRAMKK